MIRVQLYHALPSDTWALAYVIPDHANITGLVAGFRTLDLAKRGALYLSQRLGLELRYVA